MLTPDEREELTVEFLRIATSLAETGVEAHDAIQAASTLSFQDCLRAKWTPLLQSADELKEGPAKCTVACQFQLYGKTPKSTVKLKISTTETEERTVVLDDNNQIQFEL